jgi:hypothetical protein
MGEKRLIPAVRGAAIEPLRSTERRLLRHHDGRGQGRVAEIQRDRIVDAAAHAGR